jgi:hypothetical protein
MEPVDVELPSVGTSRKRYRRKLLDVTGDVHDDEPAEQYSKKLLCTFQSAADKLFFEELFSQVKKIFRQAANRNTDTLVKAFQFICDHHKCDIQAYQSHMDSPLVPPPTPGNDFRSPMVRNNFRSPSGHTFQSPPGHDFRLAPAPGNDFRSPMVPGNNFRSPSGHTFQSPVMPSPAHDSRSPGPPTKAVMEETRQNEASKKEGQFLCNTDSLQDLVTTVQNHGQSCQKYLHCVKRAFTACVCSITYQCDDLHTVRWTSSVVIGDQHYATNVRCIMAFTCSGMLRVQFDKFITFLGIRPLSEKLFSSIRLPLAMTISALHEESVAGALYEEAQKTAETTVDDQCIRIMSDARHACRKNSYHTDVIAIGQRTHKVVSVEHVTKDDDVCTQRHEFIGTERLYANFNNKSIRVSKMLIIYNISWGIIL